MWKLRNEENRQHANKVQCILLSVQSFVEIKERITVGSQPSKSSYKCLLNKSNCINIIQRHIQLYSRQKESESSFWITHCSAGQRHIETVCEQRKRLFHRSLTVKENDICNRGNGAQQR